MYPFNELEPVTWGRGGYCHIEAYQGQCGVLLVTNLMKNGGGMTVANDLIGSFEPFLKVFIAPGVCSRERRPQPV